MFRSTAIYQTMRSKRLKLISLWNFTVLKSNGGLSNGYVHGYVPFRRVFLNIDDTGLKLDYACQIIAKNLDAILRIYSIGFITSFSGIAKFVVNDCLPFNSDVSMDVRRE